MGRVFAFHAAERDSIQMSPMIPEVVPRMVPESRTSNNSQTLPGVVQITPKKSFLIYIYIYEQQKRKKYLKILLNIYLKFY